MMKKRTNVAIVVAGLCFGIQSASAKPINEWYAKRATHLAYQKPSGEELIASTDCNEDIGQPSLTLVHMPPQEISDEATDIFDTADIMGAITQGDYEKRIGVDGASLHYSSRTLASTVYDDAPLADMLNPNAQVKERLAIVSWHSFNEDTLQSKLVSQIMNGKNTLDIHYVKPTASYPHYSTEFPVQGLKNLMESHLTPQLMTCGKHEWRLTGR